MANNACRSFWIIPLILLCPACWFSPDNSRGCITCKGVNPHEWEQSLHFIDDTTILLVTSDLRGGVTPCVYLSRNGGLDWKPEIRWDSLWQYCAATSRSQDFFLALFRRDSRQSYVLRWNIPENRMDSLCLGERPVFRSGLWPAEDGGVYVLRKTSQNDEAELDYLNVDFSEIQLVRPLHGRLFTLDVLGNGNNVSFSREDGVVLDTPDSLFYLQKGTRLKPYSIAGKSILVSEEFRASSSSSFLMSWDASTGQLDTIQCFKGYDAVTLFYAEEGLLAGYAVYESDGFPGRDLVFSNNSGKEWIIKKAGFFGTHCECVFENRIFVYQNGKLYWFILNPNVPVR